MPTRNVAPSPVPNPDALGRIAKMASDLVRVAEREAVPLTIVVGGFPEDATEMIRWGSTADAVMGFRHLTAHLLAVIPAELHETFADGFAAIVAKARK